jgi:hypothetical protein
MIYKLETYDGKVFELDQNSYQTIEKNILEEIKNLFYASAKFHTKMCPWLAEKTLLWARCDPSC